MRQFTFEWLSLQEVKVRKEAHRISPSFDDTLVELFGDYPKKLRVVFRKNGTFTAHASALSAGLVGWWQFRSATGHFFQVCDERLEKAAPALRAALAEGVRLDIVEVKK
jgi:hypothetical protein